MNISNKRMRWCGAAISLIFGVVLLRADDKPSGNAATDKLVIPGTTVEFTMVKVPAGKITIKDKDGKDKEYEIKPFWIGQYEVTWDLFDPFWQRLDLTSDQRAADVDAANRPSKPYMPPDRNWGHSGSPAGSLFCREAKRYCAWLSKRTGHHYRLPTEAEWEYACRAGGPEVKLDKTALKEAAWYEDNSDYQTQPVGKKKPNAWGLYDMLGNVAEWVTTMDGEEAAAGGSYKDEAEDIRPSQREKYNKNLQKSDSQLPKGSSWLSDGAHLGFRLVRED